MNNLKLKAVQLDLQRQYENPDAICRFIVFAASCGYNAVLLSLGDRVATPCYPCRKGYEAYSAEDIRGIVACGRKLGLDIIPGIPTLGHAEDFLSHPEMEEMAELRNHTPGRWGSSDLIDFCPTSPRLQAFLKQYFTELAELFPSQWVHAGLDEAWDIGFCDRCRPIARQPGGEARLCLQSLMQTHAILTGLGKRMLIWDDMFDYYPEILPEVPRDVVMVDWQYQRSVRHYQAHFTDLRREERLQTYNRLGFDFIISPADYNIANIRSFCSYAAPAAPMGGLLTLWGKHVFFNEKSLPAVAYAGALFSGKSPEEAWTLALQKSFQQKIPAGSVMDTALKFSYETSWIHSDMLINPSMLICSPSFGEDVSVPVSLQMTLAALQPLAGTVARDLKDALEGAVLRLQIHHQYYAAATGHGPLPDLNRILRLIEDHSRKREELWHELRPGITPCRTTEFYNQCRQFCSDMDRLIRTGSYLQVRFMHPVQYGAPIIRLSLQTENGWRKIAERGCNMAYHHAEDDWNTSRFEYLFFCPPCSPAALRIEITGYGGTGIEYVEYHSPDGTYLPAELGSQAGEIFHPGHILTDDGRFTWFGSGDIHHDFLNPPAVSPRLDLTLNKQ